MNMRTIIATALSLTAGGLAYAGSVTLSDSDFSVKNSIGATVTAETAFEARWGFFSGGIFTPIYGSASVEGNQGYLYVSPGGNEISVGLSAGDNTVVPAGSALYLAFLDAVDDTVYSGSINQIVLSDPSWIAPTFTAVTPTLDFALTSQTTVVKGQASQYSYNSGNQVISFQSVPEPSSYAALAGMMVLGAVATRRRRSA